MGAMAYTCLLIRPHLDELDTFCSVIWSACSKGPSKKKTLMFGGYNLVDSI
jgi:hypothetical protein